MFDPIGAARRRVFQGMLAAKMASIPGAYRVQIKDGQIIIHAKTRVPRAGRCNNS